MKTDETSRAVDALRTAILVINPAGRTAEEAAQTREAVADWLRGESWTIVHASIVACDSAELSRAFESLSAPVEAIVVCGATGLGAEDIAPQTLERLCDFAVPGIGEMLRAESLKYSRKAYLSRCGGYVSKGRLVLSIPGNPKAAVEQLGILRELLPNAIRSVRGHCKSRSEKP